MELRICRGKGTMHDGGARIRSGRENPLLTRVPHQRASMTVRWLQVDIDQRKAQALWAYLDDIDTLQTVGSRDYYVYVFYGFAAG